MAKNFIGRIKSDKLFISGESVVPPFILKVRGSEKSVNFKLSNALHGTVILCSAPFGRSRLRLPGIVLPYNCKE
jgi:hypothetical protein